MNYRFFKAVLIALLLSLSGGICLADTKTLAKLMFEPNLLSKKVKPVGKVRIDWTNPLTKGLSYALVLQEGGGYPRNLVTGAAIETTTAWQVGRYGIEIDDTQYSPDSGYSSQQNHSVFVWGTPGAFNSDQGIFDTGNQASLVWLDTWDPGPGSALRIAVYAGGTPAYGTTATGPGTLVPVTAGASLQWTGSQFNADGYLNGVQEFAGQNVGTATGTGLHFLDNGSSSKSWSGQVYVYFAWSGRVLASAEHANLHDDPFQFLIPDVPAGMAYMVPSAAADGKLLLKMLYGH